MKATTAMTARVTPPNTTTLASRTDSRRVTAAKVVRIMPVEYSAVTTSTPSTPTMSWVRWKPARLRATGSLLVIAGPGPPPPVVPPEPAIEENMTPSSTAARAAMPSPTVVERTVRSLIHSLRKTRRWVTWAPGVRSTVPWSGAVGTVSSGSGEVVSMVVAMVVTQPFPWWGRRRGTPRSRG